MEALQEQLDQAVEERDTAEQFSQEWFVAKAKVERLLGEIGKIKFAQHHRTSVPADAVFVDWDSYDDD